MEEFDDVGFGDELKPGTRLLHGQFTIESFLNAGGFGITYLARDSLNRRAVVKECFPAAYCRRADTLVAPRTRQRAEDFRSVVQLFLQEAHTLARLDHPNIVKVHQVFEDNDTAYIAMDHVQGPDLLETVEGKASPLSPAQIRSALAQVLDALGYVHAQGVLHRDISPDNILFDLATERPVLIDFGAARKSVTRKSRALSGLRVVKDGYSPQEFYISGSLQTPASDLYALAASFSHLITGAAPKSSQERLSAIANRSGDPQIPLLGRVEGYPAPFLAALDKAMSIFPRDRLQSAADWQAMLDGPVTLLPSPVSLPAAVVSVPSPQPRPGLREGLGAATAAATRQLARLSAHLKDLLSRNRRHPDAMAAPVRSLQQPFLSDPADPGLVTERLPWSPAWVVPGMQIVEINGKPVQQGSDLQQMMTGAADLSATDMLRVIFGCVTVGGNDVLRKAETLPVVDRLDLAQDIVVEGRAGSPLVMASRPRPEQGDLCPGDVLVSYAPTGEILTSIALLQQILSRETGRDVATFSFTIQRSGSMVPGTLRLRGGG